MEKWKERLRTFNESWNDLPRRLLWIVGMVVCLFAMLHLFRFVAPFVIAALFAWIIDPAVRFLTRILGGSKVVRGILSALFVILLSSLIIFLLLVLIGQLFEEGKALALALPGWVSNASSQLIAWIESIDWNWLVVDAELEETLLQLLSELTTMLTSLATRVASVVARGAWRTASLVPQAVLFVVLTLMGTFYMSADKERIFGFLRSLLPERLRARSNVFRASILRAVLTQLRASLIMLLVTFAEISVGFLIMGLDYAVLLGLIIALLDALPVIGAGLFLIPMCLYGIVFGDLTFALGGGLIYLMTIVVRQLLEPRIIGRQLGLYPLATMMAMYAGMQAVGVLGLILGPITMLLCKVALTAPPSEDEEAQPPKPAFKWPSMKRKAAGGDDQGKAE